MNPDMEIKITIRGGEPGAGGIRVTGPSEALAPSPEAGELGAGYAQGGDIAPSPADALGTAVAGADAAPSPGADAVSAGASAGAALPEPVPLDQIELLGSFTSAESGGNNVPPSPDGGEG